ncbi:MAG: hypothetical protein OEV44_14070 [Spirochaetota bacterium]|nr:hypothetical protein [Spirochaetota bacterium]
MNKSIEVFDKINEYILEEKYTKGILYLKQVPDSPQNNWHNHYKKLNHFRFLKKIHFDEIANSIKSYEKFYLFIGISLVFFLL